MAEAQPASGGEAVVDAATRYFAASGYSEMSKTDAVALTKSVCRSVARQGVLCANLGDTRVAFSGGDTTFVLATRGADWIFIGLHGSSVAEGLELDRDEILCASYIADELKKGVKDQPTVAQLLRPVARLGQYRDIHSKGLYLSGIETSTGHMIFYRKDRKVECHLFGNVGGPPVVSASLTLQRPE
jgi:hypothetical protein